MDASGGALAGLARITSEQLLPPQAGHLFLAQRPDNMSVSTLAIPTSSPPGIPCAGPKVFTLSLVSDRPGLGTR